MEVVASRAGDNVDLSARAAPILRTVKAAQNFELGDGIHTGEVEQAEVAATVYVIGAVNGPVVL